MSPFSRSRLPPIATGFQYGTGPQNIFRISIESPTSSQTPIIVRVGETSSFPGATSQAENLSASPSTSKPKSTDRARNESRKLFAHVLGQLERRPMPPPVFNEYASIGDASTDNHIGFFVEKVKDALRLGARKREEKPLTQTVEDDSDDEDGRSFSTDATYDLMIQLRDVLTMSIAQGWHIFDDGLTMDGNARYKSTRKSTSPFRRSGNSLQPGGRRSRSPSPVRGIQIEAPELLSLCISVLTSVVLEDCRYKTTFPRPSRPPYGLQAMTLDIAQFLLHTHLHDPKAICQIGIAMIPAFYTFNSGMHTRLLAFFEENIIRGTLIGLRQIQGLVGIDPNGDGIRGDHPEAGGPPIISIQVDEAQENTLPEFTHSNWLPWLPSPLTSLKITSSSAPSQSLAVYYLASLVPPLLAAILECVDISPQSDARVEVLHRFHRLLSFIVDTKIDAYSDLLQVVAYHTPTARKSAVHALTTFCPKALGHMVVTQPFPPSSYVDTMDVRLTSTQLQDHPYDHQFVPWRFTARYPTFSGLSQHDCRACLKPIRDFGLLCPFCMCAVHFQCYDYPEGSHVVQYSEQNVQRLAMYRFSKILSNRRDKDMCITHRHKHLFRQVNIFTLCLCSICQSPLLGCIAQGLACISCMQFVHATCLSGSTVSHLPPCSNWKVTLDHMTIDWSRLRRSCVDFYRDILHLTYEQLGKMTYEEVSILHATLWVQMQILTSGIALGTIIVIHSGRDAAHAVDHGVDEFELHHVLQWCETHLTMARLPCSDIMDDYMQENRLSPSEHSIMFDWANLAYIATTIRSSFTPQHSSNSPSSDFLSVIQPDVLADNPSDSQSYPFEVISLSHMREVLGHVLHIHSDSAAKSILMHMHHLGFFERFDRSPNLFDNASHIYCTFPLPLGLDLSVNVETLVSAVEACLSDLDLSVNEVGFLMLLRRLWPNGLTSEYALRRLARSTVNWILAEDDNLAIILRDYLEKQKSLPGVQSGHKAISWPSVQSSRPTPSSSVNNGGDYVAARRALLARYATPWLLALHDQDRAVYARLIYDTSREVDDATPQNGNHGKFQPDLEGKSRSAIQCDRVLRAISKLLQASVAFTVFDDLLILWLELVSTGGLFEEPMPSLLRLFPRGGDVSYRSSTSVYSMIDSTVDDGGTAIIEPWRAVIRIASQSKEEFSRTLPWLCVFACSGVEIPIAIFMRFSSLVDSFETSLTSSLMLVKAALWSTWLKSIDRPELQKLISALHSRFSHYVVDCLKSARNVADSICFIRQSLVTCLLLYGCERDKIIDLGMIQNEEIRGLPSRRKLNVRRSMVSDPIIVDPGLIDAIKSYMTVPVDVVSCLIAKFLNTFLTESPYLEPHEVDNFILRNGRLLATCAWQFYAIQHHEISSIRTTFLLRTLVVDSQPFQNILHDWFLANDKWEQRLEAVTRLFRIILDVKSPSFNVEGRQWRSSTNDIFYYFFNAMWADERAEIRLAVDTFASTLLPAHLDAISLCWNESLTKSPIAERVKLLSFLIQLRPHFPHWRVLAWDVIVETLLEDDYDQRTFNYENELATARLSFYDTSSRNEVSRQPQTDSDMALLRVSILLLSLRMIADGIPIDNFTLMKIKIHLVRVIGFSDVLVVPSQSGHAFRVLFGEAREIPELALPCVNELQLVLDAHYPIDLSPSTMNNMGEVDDRASTLLVGSIFVDTILAMFCTVLDLLSLPILTVKSLLESLCIMIYKHDFDSRPLRHLQQPLRRAVLRALDILLQNTSRELLQLALSIAQALIKRWPSFMGSVVYTAIESVARLVASQHHHVQDALVAQAKSFLDYTLSTYASNGLFTNLLKRRLDREFFIVLKQITDANAKNSPTLPESLRDALLRDALTHTVDSDQNAFNNAIHNTQTYIDVVHHQGYSTDLMLFVGQQLTHIAKRALEWSADSVDPSPLLVIPALLIQHNKANCRELLSYTETVMRVVLSRLNIDARSLSRLLEVTLSLYRRSQYNDPAVPMNNSIVLLIFEMLADGLRMKSRVSPYTLQSMLEAIMTTTIPGTLPPVIRHLPSFVSLVEPGLHFLYSHLWQDANSGSDFTASLAVGKMIFQVAGRDPSVMNKLSDHGSERNTATNLGVRAWNILVLTALLEPTENSSHMLFTRLSAFSNTYHTVLKPYVQSGIIPANSATTDINHLYIALKLWVMLAHRVSLQGDAGDSMAFAVWNELWPPFEGLMSVLEIEVRNGLSLTLAILVTSSIADLFVFLRTLHTPIALHTSTHIVTLNRLRNFRLGEASTGKLARALRCMSVAPPEISFEVLVNQAGKDLVAAEKLRVLDAKKEVVRTVPERRVPDRYRREERATT